MRKTISIIALAFGLVFSIVPAAGAGSGQPCTTGAPGGNQSPCAPECVPTVDLLNARLAAAYQTVTDRNVTIAAMVAWQDRATARLARKNARIQRLVQKLAQARANG